LDALRPEHEGEAVRVMTVHQAKGLEFPVVGIGSAQEGRFPGRFRRASYPVPTELRLSGESDDPDEHVRDQRRLFYVAMTRAQDLLIIGASDKVAKRGSGVSRFVREIGKEHLTEPMGLPPPGRIGLRRKPATVTRRRMAYSAMHSYLLCPLQYKLLHACGFASPGQHWFDLGLALHRALELVHRRALEGTRVDVAGAEAIWRDVWRPGRSWTAERVAQLDRTGLVYLRQYVEAHGERLGRVRLVEEPIELPVGEGLQLSGRLDLACRTEGGLEVLEFKVRTRRGLEDLHPEFQVETYALALEQVRKEPIAKVGVHLLAEKPGRDMELRAWDETVAAQAQRRVQTAAEGIQKGRFAPNPGPHCRFCDFRALCPESRARVPWTQEVEDDIPLGATP
jgi:DNA helicase-2/ATP-dependent DNA helicase PcrA